MDFRGQDRSSWLQQHLEKSKHLVEVIVDQIDRTDRPEPDLIRNCIVALIDHHRHETRLNEALLENIDYPEEIRILIQGMQEEIESRLTDLIVRSPAIHSDNPSLTAWLVLQTITSLADQYAIYDHERFNEEEFVIALSAIIEKMLY